MTKENLPFITFFKKNQGWKYLTIFLGGLLIVFASVAISNYYLNPLMYNSSYHRQVASYLAKGYNYEIFDPNINWRLLRREHIREMTNTPDILLFGGSRFQEASSKLVPNKSFYNAFIHSDYYEDVLALTKILLDAKRLPKTLILSVRYQTFVPFDKRNSNEWLTFAPEYRTLATELQLTSTSWLQTFPTQLQDLGNLFSVEAMKEQIKSRQNTSSSPKETKEIFSEEFDIIKTDGSMNWSGKHQKKFTSEYALKDSSKKAKLNQGKQLEINSTLVEGFGKLIDFVQSQGTRVILVQTPFHPAFYSKVSNQPFGKDLQRIEAQAYDLAQAHNVVAVGSFNPEKIGCSASMFIDWHHANQECLAKIFNAIPNL